MTVNAFATPGGTNLLGGAVTLRRNPKPGESNNPAKQWIFNNAKTNYNLTHGKTISDVVKDKRAPTKENNTKQETRKMAPAHKVANGNKDIPYSSNVNYEALKLYKKCANAGLLRAGYGLAKNIFGKSVPGRTLAGNVVTGAGLGTAMDLAHSHAFGEPMTQSQMFPGASAVPLATAAAFPFLARSNLLGKRPRRSLRLADSVSNQAHGLNLLGNLQAKTWGEGTSMILNPREAVESKLQSSTARLLDEASSRLGFSDPVSMQQNIRKLRFLKYLPPYS
jgi:hypothetical protein